MKKALKNTAELLNLSALPPEEQEELLLEFGDLVFRNAVLRLIEQMSETDREAFGALLDSDPSEDDVIAFIDERVPELNAVLEETLADIRSDILAVTES